MPKVIEKDGCSFYINTLDHEPPHTHVTVGDGVIILFLDEEVSVRKLKGSVKAGEVRKARKVARENMEQLLQAWDQVHGKESEEK